MRQNFPIEVMVRNLKQKVPFFRVTSMERSTEYYVRGLGFENKNGLVPQGLLTMHRSREPIVGLPALTDPDGYRLELEMLTHVPEGTK